MSNIDVDLDYFTHRKTVRLVGMLGEAHVAIPIKLWVYAGKYHCEDGSLKGYSVQEIESILGWKGKRGILVDAMVTIGFLDKLSSPDGDYYQVHDWLEHAGHLIALKKRAKVNAEKRWSKLAGGDTTSITRNDATSITRNDATSTPSSTATPMLPPSFPPTYLPTSLPSAGASRSDRMCAPHVEEKIPPVMFKTQHSLPPGEPPPPEVAEKLARIGVIVPKPQRARGES